MIKREQKFTTGNLNLRSLPEVREGTVLKTLPTGSEFIALDPLIYNDGGRIWQYGYGANIGGWVASEYLTGVKPAPVPPPPPPPPTTIKKPKFGAHIHLDKNINKVYQFIEAYQPPSVTVISDVPLIRWIIEHKYVKYPIFRQVWSAWDEQPEHVGDESDIERGKRWAYEGIDRHRNLWWWNKQCPHGTILQLNNETNSWKMSHFNIGMMQAMNAEGYKVIIDNFGVGQPADAVVNGQRVRALWFDEQGNPHSDIVPGTNKTLWEHVIPGWRYAQQTSNFVGVHMYGNEEDGQHRYPGSPIGLPYYGKRLHNFLRMMPKPWPFIIVDEWGSGKTERQKGAGFESHWNGVKEYLPLINEIEEILCINDWTWGDYAGHLGFPGASVDDWTDQMIARRGELPLPA